MVLGNSGITLHLDCPSLHCMFNIMPLTCKWVFGHGWPDNNEQRCTNYRLDGQNSQTILYPITHAIITLSLFILNPLFEGPKRLLLLFVLKILALFMGIQEEFLIKSGL